MKGSERAGCLGHRGVEAAVVARGQWPQRDQGDRWVETLDRDMAGRGERGACQTDD